MTYQVQKALRNLKYILLNERSQPLKAKHCLISTSGHSGKEETVKIVKGSQIPGEEKGTNR